MSGACSAPHAQQVELEAAALGTNATTVDYSSIWNIDISPTSSRDTFVCVFVYLSFSISRASRP